MQVYVNGTSWQPAVTLAAGTWYHIAVTRASGTTRLYVNGNLNDEAISTFSEIFEVDPDNKTGYHTHAWYMLGLTYLSFAWLHSHLGANKVAPRAEIPKEKISSYYFTSMRYILKTVNCLLANPNGLWYRDGQPTKMFLISDIFFPYEPFAEACRDAIIIAKRELGLV